MHSMMPLVSVITPMYRSADTLSAALNSLLRQDEWRWESIIVDDGSPDNSLAVAKEFARRDPRFHVMSQANSGACAARNAGLGAARGRYVLFLDADDWLEPAALSSMSHACERKNWSAVHGAFRYARPDGTITQWTGTYNGDIPLFDALSSSNVLSLPSCVMLRRSVLDDIGGGFDPSLAHCGDWDLWARLARNEGRIGQIEACVTGYRMRMASLSRNPVTLLRDASKVLARIHGHDSRVKHPLKRLFLGADSALLSVRMAGFTFYAAALATLQGRLDDATTIMNSLPTWPAIAADRVAEFLIHAACFSRCVAPDDLRPLPLDMQDGINRIVADLQRRTGVASLTPDVGRAMERLGFGRSAEVLRGADRARLLRPLAADETLASGYLRSLALSEFGGCGYA